MHWKEERIRMLVTSTNDHPNTAPGLWEVTANERPRYVNPQDTRVWSVLTLAEGHPGSCGKMEKQTWSVSLKLGKNLFFF